MTVFLVEVTTVVQLVDRLKKGKYRSSQDVLAKSGLLYLFFCLSCLSLVIVFKPSSDDDEIVAGPQKMSLKCPVC